MKSWPSVGDAGLHTHIDMVEEIGQGRGKGSKPFLVEETAQWRLVVESHLCPLPCLGGTPSKMCFFFFPRHPVSFSR